MNNYENLLQELLFGANELIKQTNNVNDKFDMSIRLAEQVRKALKLNIPLVPVQQEEVEEVPQVVEVVEQVEEVVEYLVKSKKQYEKMLGYKISNEAYQEYKEIQERLKNGEQLNLWIPDPDGLCPIPADAIVTLAVKENPALKHLFEEKVEEEPVEELIEEPEVEVSVVEEEPVELTVEQAIETALNAEDNGVEIDIDEDPAPEQVIAEIDGEQMDITEQYNFIKGLNNELTYDEAVERAVDWIEFGIQEETYNMLSFIENKSVDIIQCKTYLAYYIDAMEVDSIVYYINYFASNIEEDENGEEVYVGEELQLEFLNEDNINAFLEYVQQNQQ